LVRFEIWGEYNYKNGMRYLLPINWYCASQRHRLGGQSQAIHFPKRTNRSRLPENSGYQADDPTRFLHAEAQNFMGALYYHGYGVAQDFKEAIKWYRLAAGQRNLDAQLNLGSVYYEGEGVAEDLARSHIWLSFVADHGYVDAAKMRDTVKKEMTAAQASQAQAMQRKCQASNYKDCD
jgi:TPR repeat protein